MKGVLYHFIIKFEAGKKLRFAANLNDIEMVHKLLDDGVDPNSIDSRNRTALHFCACKNFVEIGIAIINHIQRIV